MTITQALENEVCADLMADIFRAAITTKQETGADVFVRYSPHVQRASVEIYPDGWLSSIDPAREWVFQTNNADSLEIVAGEIEEATKQLKAQKGGK